MAMEIAPEQQQSPSSTAPPAQTQGPSLRTIPFHNNALLRQAATMLRRVWLLDPPLSHEELADPATVQECFRAICGAIGSGIEADGDESKWDHELWRKHTQFKLLEPVVTAAGKGEEAGDLSSVVSPWREEIYDIYRHVFSDLWRALVQQTAAAGDERPGQLGRYDPNRGDAVTLVVLPAEEIKKADQTAFTTDTFLYPVWVHPHAKISFATPGSDDMDHVWAAREEATWTTGLWVRAGRDVVLTTEMVGAGSGGEEGIAAVFVTGHCEARGGALGVEKKGTAQETMVSDGKAAGKEGKEVAEGATATAAETGSGS